MGALKFSIDSQGMSEIKAVLAQACSKAEHKLAAQVRKDTDPFVPALTGSMSERAIVVGNKVIYPGPYARYLYYGKVMVDPKTGSPYVPEGGRKVVTDRNLVFTQSMHRQAQSHWFEASKAQNLQKWLRTAKKEVSKHGKD